MSREQGRTDGRRRGEWGLTPLLLKFTYVKSLPSAFLINHVALRGVPSGAGREVILQTFKSSFFCFIIYDNFQKASNKSLTSPPPKFSLLRDISGYAPIALGASVRPCKRNKKQIVTIAE